MLTAHTVGLPTTYLPRFCRVFAISEAVRADLARRGFPGSVVVLNGIDFAAFTRKTTYTDYQSGFRLVQISRLLHSHKGQDVALRAMHHLVHAQGCHHLHLSLVGEGPSQEFLEDLARELNLEAHVSFLGSRDRAWVMAELHTFDVLLQPSRLEGFGLTLLEGIAAGLPVVASDVEGPAEILRDLPTGLLCPPGDAAALAAQLQVVFGRYRAGQLAVGASAAHAVAESRFSVHQTAANYLRLYPTGLAQGTLA